MKNTTSTDRAAFEKAFLKAAMKRYKRWRKAHGTVKPFGSATGILKRDSWDMMKAIETLYEATHGR